jgi:hypothetical protein
MPKKNPKHSENANTKLKITGITYNLEIDSSKGYKAYTVNKYTEVMLPMK